jgi:hypothetical protein
VPSAYPAAGVNSSNCAALRGRHRGRGGGRVAGHWASSPGASGAEGRAPATLRPPSSPRRLRALHCCDRMLLRVRVPEARLARPGARRTDAHGACLAVAQVGGSCGGRRRAARSRRRPRPPIFTAAGNGAAGASGATGRAAGEQLPADPAALPCCLAGCRLRGRARDRSARRSRAFVQCVRLCACVAC